MAGAGYKLFNTGDVLTAAQVNTYLQEQTVMVFASSTARTTALSGVLAEGMMSYLTDTNSVEVYNGSAWEAVGGASIPANDSATVATAQTTTSTTYTDLTTAGPAVTLTTGTKALVIITCRIDGDGNNRTAYMSYAVSGASTVAASDSVSLSIKDPTQPQSNQVRASAASVVSLTAGSNTFTAKYRIDATNTGTFANREIFVINLA